ncbi:MAG: hypothetical protein ACRC0J_10040 [Shewanella oncorhynchi]
MKCIVIWDLDGTLADGQGRLHLLPKKEDAHVNQAWDKFNLAAFDDLPILDNIQLMNMMYAMGMEVIILTGRSAVAVNLTKAWLINHGCDYSRIIMRGVDDHRKDVDFKEAMLRAIGLDNILCCFDDLEHVAKHIRGIGLTCHLVTHYDTPKVHNSEIRK